MAGLRGSSQPSRLMRLGGRPPANWICPRLINSGGCRSGDPGGFSFVYLQAGRGRNQAALLKRGSSQQCPQDGCHPLRLKWLPRVTGRCLAPLTPSHGRTARCGAEGGGSGPGGRWKGGWRGTGAACRAWPGLPELVLRGALPWWGLGCGLSGPEGAAGGMLRRRAGKPWAIGRSPYAVRPCP